MTPLERMYSYTQSSQIESQSGCIGHLRADMGSDGKSFFSSWTDHRGDLKTEDFKNEFDELINALRSDKQYGGMLKDLRSLSKYCYSHPESSYGNDQEFGFRADTPSYTFMMRLNPHRGVYNLYCYCFRRDWLERHMNSAEKGIRFITPHYKEKFRLTDGDAIRVTGADGESQEHICRSRVTSMRCAARPTPLPTSRRSRVRCHGRSSAGRRVVACIVAWPSARRA